MKDQVTSHHVTDLQRPNTNKDYLTSPTIHPLWNAHSDRHMVTHTHAPPPTHTHTFSACICCILTAGETVPSIMGHGGTQRVTEVIQTKRHHVAKKKFRFSLSHSSSLHFMPLSPYKTSCPVSVYIFTSFCAKEWRIHAELSVDQNPQSRARITAEKC